MLKLTPLLCESHHAVVARSKPMPKAKAPKKMEPTLSIPRAVPVSANLCESGREIAKASVERALEPEIGGCCKSR